VQQLGIKYYIQIICVFEIQFMYLNFSSCMCNSNIITKKLKMSFSTVLSSMSCAMAAPEFWDTMFLHTMWLIVMQKWY